MMSSVQRFLFLLQIIIYWTKSVESRSVVINNNNVKGYYWRDYTGEVPEDALPGGRDSHGNVLYVAQVLKGEFLIPGQFNQTDHKVHYDYWHKEVETTENVKILCTRHPEHFKWLKTSNELFERVKGKHLVLGGFQPTYTTYIGRLSSDEEILIGKIMVDKNDVKELHITRNGQAISYNSFEVLEYDDGISSNEENTLEVKSFPEKYAGKLESSNEFECVKHIININVS